MGQTTKFLLMMALSLHQQKQRRLAIQAAKLANLKLQWMMMQAIADDPDTDSDSDSESDGDTEMAAVEIYALAADDVVDDTPRARKRVKSDLATRKQTLELASLRKAPGSEEQIGDEVAGKQEEDKDKVVVEKRYSGSEQGRARIAAWITACQAVDFSAKGLSPLPKLPGGTAEGEIALG